MSDPAPSPPPNLHARRLSLIHIRAGVLLYRLHDRHRNALFFGPQHGHPPTGRWDSPSGRYGICYAADPRTPHAAFVERFLRAPGRLILALTDMEGVACAELRVCRDLTLVRFRGTGLVRIGATADVAHGDHRMSRPWSAALYDHPARPDGIQWRSRLDDDALALALFERAGPALDPIRSVPMLSKEFRPTLAAWLDRYGVGLV